MDSQLLERLERDGVVILPGRLDDVQLKQMQRSFSQRVSRRAVNHTMGYHATDPYRQIVDDVLMLGRGFAQAALNEELVGLVQAYLGERACLTEAKGWRSKRTKRDVHGWHSDAWYDKRMEQAPKQLKLGLYLTDVETGAFEYLKGSQGQRPTHWSNTRADRWEGGKMRVLGPAGTMFVFDSSGIHRQECPILTSRDAVFFVYHDPQVPLQPEDIKVNRYHPARISVEALMGLSAVQLAVLGLGRQELVDAQWAYQPKHPRLERVTEAVFDAYMWAEHLVVTGQYAVRGMKQRLMR